MSAAVREPRLPAPTRAILWAILAMSAFVTVPISVRMLAGGLPVSEVVFIRNVIGFALMVPWALAVGPRRLWPQRYSLNALRAGFNVVGMMLWFWGLGLIPVADAVALQFTLPLFALVLAVLFLGERVGIRRSTATLVGFGGALVIIRPGFAEVGLAALAVLGSALMYASTVVVMRRQSRTDSPYLLMFHVTLLMAALAAPFALIHWTPPAPGHWPWLALVGVGGWLAQFSLTRALALADTKVVMPFDFLRLPLTAFAAYPLFGEFPDAWTWAGAAIIFAAASYVAHRDARIARERRAPPPPGNLPAG